MAGTKKSKTPEPEVVSNSPIHQDSGSGSESGSESGSDSFEVSLKSQMQNQSNRSKNPPESPKPEPESESESGSEEDEVVADSEESDVEESEEEKVKIEETNGHSKVVQNGNGKVSEKKRGKEKEKEKEGEKSDSALYKLPMRRISRIIKGENADMRITHEATFLINKATEKFLELFAKEAYACAFLDRKNQVAYGHLSKVVAKRRRFGFLSDFVPEQVKAEDALAELSTNEK